MWVHQKKGFTLTVRRMIIADTKNFIFLPRSPHAARPPPPNFVVLSNKFTLEFMWFVVPGHYGCLRAFKHKSFFVEGILKSEFMKHVYSIKYMSQMYHLEFGVAFTMFFIAPLTLSRHNKLTVSKTLPSSFTIKSTWLKSTLVICLSICRIERKKCNLDVYGSKIRSQDQFPKRNPT